MHPIRTALKLAAGAALIGILLLAPAHDATAQRGKDGYGTVTAHSRYANPSRTGRVRPSRFGREVEIGNNTWMHCEAGDCASTLRRHKVDFWETIREDGRSSRD